MKIKKYLSFILITIIVSIGLFNIVPKAHAQTLNTAAPTPSSSLGTIPSFSTSTSSTTLNSTTPTPSSSLGTVPSFTSTPLSLPSSLSSQSSSFSSTTTPITGLASLITKIQQLLNSIVPILIALGVVYFVFGVVQYVINDSEEAKKKGRDKIIYGLIGFAVIIGLWGLVNLIVNTFSLGGTAAPKLGSIVGTSSSCTGISSTSKFQDVLCYITNIINSYVIPLIFALATVMFVWGVVNFLIINSEDEKKRSEGKQFMIWGVVALAVMLSVWGLVGILGNTFSIKTSILPQTTPPTQ